MRGWLLTFTLALVMLVSSAATATDLADFHPVAGPTTVDLGKDLAALSVGADYYFVDASFKPGKRYEEFVKGTDKVAEYGLAALVAGGAGVAVVKAAQAGLFARFWKVIVLGGFAAIGGVWKWLTGRGKTTTA